MASSLRVNNIMDNLDKKSANFLHAKRVIDTLTNFICSYDDCISSEHVPYRDLTTEDSDGDRSKLEYFNSDAYIKVITRDASFARFVMNDSTFRLNLGQQNEITTATILVKTLATHTIILWGFY